MGMFGDSRGNGRVAGVEQVSFSQIQFPARYTLWMLCCGLDNPAKLDGVPRSQRGASGNISENVMTLLAYPERVR